MSDFANKKGTEETGFSFTRDCVFDWTSGESLTGSYGLDLCSRAVSPVVLESDIFSDAGK